MRTLTIGEIVETLGFRPLTGGAGLQRQVRGGYSGDLLSDVMAHAGSGSLWFTIQSHLNVVAVALLAGLAGVVICRGVQPEAATLRRAEQEGIPILVTEENAFVAAGRLYQLLAEEEKAAGPNVETNLM